MTLSISSKCSNFGHRLTHRILLLFLKYVLLPLFIPNDFLNFCLHSWVFSPEICQFYLFKGTLFTSLIISVEFVYYFVNVHIYLYCCL